MSRTTNEFRIEIAKLLFHNLPMPGIGDAAGLQPSTAGGNYWISLHIADPGQEGSQATNEVSYSGYARVAVPRNVSGWNIRGVEIGQVTGEVSNAAQVLFPRCTSGSATVTHIGIGTSASGAGKLLWMTPLEEPASAEVTPGQAPVFDPGTITLAVS